jgi:uncharacterized repeat protein (TIGR03803 family)
MFVYSVMFFGSGGNMCPIVRFFTLSVAEVTCFNQRFARLGMLLMLSCWMVLTTVYSRDSQGAEVNTISGKGYQVKRDDQANFQTLYTFPRGVQPHSLIQAADGNFYGTTLQGGTNNDGTLFRFTPEGVFTTLHSFVGATDGAWPMTELLQSQKAGDPLLLYGTTHNGGAYNQGTLFVYQPNGAVPFKTAFSFGPARYYPPELHGWGVVETSTGMFIGTTDSGGDHHRGSLYAYIPDKLFGETIYSFNASDGNGLTQSLISDHNFVYGTTFQGGANGWGTIFKFDSSNKTLETLYSFRGDSDGVLPTRRILLGKDGNLYGTTLPYSGIYSDKEAILYKLTLGNHVLTTLVSFGKGSRGFIEPFSRLIQGSDGNFYGTTSNGGENYHGSIFRVTPTGKLTTLYSWNQDRDVGAITLIQGKDGNLYGVTKSGGTDYASTIFKLSLSDKRGSTQ